MITVELTDEEAQESIGLLKDAIIPLERALAATDLAHRDHRNFLKKRLALVNELIKRIESK
jgi:hypothetical protein